MDPLRLSGKRFLSHNTEGKPGILDKHLLQDLRPGQHLIRIAPKSPLTLSSLDCAGSRKYHQRDQVPMEETLGWVSCPPALCLLSLADIDHLE